MRKDIDIGFMAHPLTGDLVVRRDEAALKQAVKNIVLTGYYERGFNIEFGTPIRQSLFELIGPLDVHTLKQNITQALQNFEPQAELIDVIVDAKVDQNELFVSIIYTYANNPTEQTLTLTLQRIR